MGAPGVEALDRTEPGGNGHVGRRLVRKEDPRLITGRATYVDDIVLPGMLFAAIVRSPEAHARILSIDTEAAKARPGVEAVYTGEDMADLAAPCPMVWVPPGVEVKVPDHWPLARGKVGYVGQAVAVVLGTDKYAVVDAAEDVIVEYDPLPVVRIPRRRSRTAPRSSTRSTAPTRCSSGRCPGGDVEGAFADADVIVEKRIVNHRTAGAAIEPRGVARRVAPGQADDVELDPDPAHRPRDPVDPAGHHRGQDPGRGARGRRRLRLQAAGVRRGGARLLVRDQDRHAGEVDGDAVGRHGRVPSRARPDRLRPDRRQARRHRHRHPREDHPGPRQLPPDRGPGDPDVQRVRDRRLLQVRRRPDGHRRRVHEQVHDRRHPRRGPPRGDPHDRAARWTRSRTSSAWTGWSCGARTSSRSSRTSSRTGSSTTRATTTGRWTAAWRSSTSTRSGASRRRRGRAASTAASASRPTSRSAASGRRARSGPRAGACRAATSSPPRCACTRPGRSRSTAAPRRTGRGSRRASPRSSPTGSASTRRSST